MKKIISVLLSATIVYMCLFLGGCLKYRSNILEVTRGDAEQPTSEYQPETEIITEEASYSVPYETQSSVEAVPESTSTEPSSVVITQPTTTQPEPTTVYNEPTTQGQKDPSQWSKDEILTYLSTAINSTKAYTGKLTVDHTEEFTMTITKCPGGKIGLNLANSIASGFLKPNTEVLEFSGGTAVDSSGKTVPLLLPKRSNFSLPSAGVKSVKAFKSGGNTVIEVVLISENGTLESKPHYNSSAIGYLDPNELDLSIVNVKTFNVEYTGSSFVVNIDSQNRVVSASYNVPVSLNASGSAIGISGEFSCTGSEKEIWKLNW